MMEEELIKYALQNTFAIAVTGFLLWKDMKVNGKVTDSLNEVTKTLAVICDKLK